MRTLIQKLRKRRKKRQHIVFLHETIAELNNGIIKDVISNNYQKNKLENKAKLLKKYNRRLKLIIY